MKRAALYLRVSTKEQTTENQRIELERVAQAKGWEIVATYEDAGVSGAKGRDKRPAFDMALKDAVRAKFEVLMSWDVSRLGRSLSGLVETLDQLQANRIDLYLHQQALDTTTPSGKAMFQMTGVFAEFERAMIRERVKAGLNRAKLNGVMLGRPKVIIDSEKFHRDVADNASVRLLAERHVISVGKAHALRKDNLVAFRSQKKT